MLTFVLKVMRKKHHIVLVERHGVLILPEVDVKVHLTPIECTLLCLFMAHPEGIMADNLPLHWQELRLIYEISSPYDDESMRDGVIESLCSESKTVFYSNVSRIKRKFVSALGARKASAYIIKRDKNGRYKTKAVL